MMATTEIGAIADPQARIDALLRAMTLEEKVQAWMAEAGEFEVLLGSSSRDMRVRATFRLTETVVFGGPPAGRRTLSVNSTVRELLEDDDARAVLERHLPGFAGNAQMGMAAGLSLIQVAGFGPEQITQERLAAIGADLATL